jgi:hypothetical protein
MISLDTVMTIGPTNPFVFPETEKEFSNTSLIFTSFGKDTD